MNDSSRKTRKLKHLIVIIVTALLAVVTTVAVSWGCALWVDPTANRSYFTKPVGGSDKEVAADPFFNWWFVQIFAVPGGTIVCSSWFDEDVLAFGMVRGWALTDRWPEHSPEEVLPQWVGESLRPPENLESSKRFHIRIGDAWGWPFVAMWSRWHGESTPLSVPTSYEYQHCVPLESRFVNQNGKYLGRNRALPLAIIWQGFALNTLVYWAAWLLVYCMFVFGVGGARRSLRRRKGNCIHCGYDLQGSANERCPECGKAS